MEVWRLSVFLSCCFSLGSQSESEPYRIQKGACSYTFLLPGAHECGGSPEEEERENSLLDYNSLLRKLQHLEMLLENNTALLHKVINQTTQLEHQLLNEIQQLKEKNSVLVKQLGELEEEKKAELESVKEEKRLLKGLVEKQSSIIRVIEEQLVRASTDTTTMNQQQQELTRTVNSLIHSISVGSTSQMMQDNPVLHSDCAEVFRSGSKDSGVYSLTVPDSKLQFQAYCDMETDGGGWTVIQRRFNGLVDFHQSWRNYTKGFGSIAGEHWLGNELISTLTRQKRYVLRIDLADWEGNAAFSRYEEFSVDADKQNYRIHVGVYSGTAGKSSSMGQPGNLFSTKDVDNDKCVCKCSAMLSGGWWFDACGPSNLNGVYYQQGQNTNRFNGIKWYYWKGSAYSLKATTMMIRPSDF